MAYRLWIGLATSVDEFTHMKPLWMPLARSTLHDVLWCAMRVNDDGSQIAWEIEGDDGTRLDRWQIAATVRERRSVLETNPPTTY
jgi:hypothetical protein